MVIDSYSGFENGYVVVSPRDDRENRNDGVCDGHLRTSHERFGDLDGDDLEGGHLLCDAFRLSMLCMGNENEIGGC